MAHWFCRECKRTHREEQMLPGWNGLWCPNCVWSDVTPAAGAGSPTATGPDRGDPGTVAAAEHGEG
jgi:hypothetical protein